MKFFTLIFCRFLIISYVTAIVCSSDGESTVLRCITVKKPQYLILRIYYWNVVENIKYSFRSNRTSDADNAEHIFWPMIIASSSLYATRVTRGQTVVYAESAGVVTSGHVKKMAVTSFDLHLPKPPCYTQTLRLYLLQNRSYCRLIFFALWE